MNAQLSLLERIWQALFVSSWLADDWEINGPRTKGMSLWIKKDAGLRAGDYVSYEGLVGKIVQLEDRGKCWVEFFKHCRYSTKVVCLRTGQQVS